MSKKSRTADRAGRRPKNTRRNSGRSERNRFGMFCIILQTVISLAFMGVVVLLDMHVSYTHLTLPTNSRV